MNALPPKSAEQLQQESTALDRAHKGLQTLDLAGVDAGLADRLRQMSERLGTYAEQKREEVAAVVTGGASEAPEAADLERRGVVFEPSVPGRPNITGNGTFVDRVQEHNGLIDSPVLSAEEKTDEIAFFQKGIAQVLQIHLKLFLTRLDGASQTSEDMWQEQLKDVLRLQGEICEFEAKTHKDVIDDHTEAQVQHLIDLLEMITGKKEREDDVFAAKTAALKSYFERREAAKAAEAA